MSKKHRRNRNNRQPHEKSRPALIPSDELLEKVDNFAERVAQELQATLPLLSKVKADRLPANIRDVADVDIAATRLGRMLQLLQGSRILARLSLGTTVAPIVRAMWETWFDTAWMLHDPQKRMERATAFWTAGIAQQLGIIRAFRERDGHLIPAFQEAMNELENIVKGEPHLYERWLDEQAQPRRSLHSINWTDEKNRGRAKQMGEMYGRSYDLDYTLLSIAAHGAGGELPRLIEESQQGTRISVGEGRDAAINYLLIGCGTALTLVYEIQHAYLGGHTATVDALREQAEPLRQECPSII